jgi:hypothetical protein
VPGVGVVARSLLYRIEHEASNSAARVLAFAQEQAAVIAYEKDWSCRLL